MARPLRIEYPGALYHITNRGNAREAIFSDTVDREAFLALLAEVIERFGWLCHAYCLMDNHYHLVVETLTRKTAHTGAVTLIQRFGSALNLNLHFHILFLDGVYFERPDGSVRFRSVKAPTSAELTDLAHKIARRVSRFLERQGLLERDEESSYLTGEGMEADPMDQLLGASITYRIAVGPQQGRKVFTLQTIPAQDDSFGDEVGKVSGFSLHAGVMASADERQKLERLCRYITRPAVSEKRLSLTEQGKVRYELKTPYRDGTTHVIFEPLDFIARLAALVPKPRVNLIRFHGVFAPNSPRRALITPAKRGKGAKTKSPDDPQPTPAERRTSMTWAQRLKRVFNIDIETCPACGGAVRINSYLIAEPHRAIRMSPLANSLRVKSKLPSALPTKHR